MSLGPHPAPEPSMPLELEKKKETPKSSVKRFFSNTSLYTISTHLRCTDIVQSLTLCTQHMCTLEGSEVSTHGYVKFGASHRYAH